MSSEDEYFSIAAKASAEIKIKGSRFLGTAAPASDVSEAEKFIQQIEKQFYDATHNCFAYRINTLQQIIDRSSDAGEPAGTAGAPIHHVILGKNLLNIVVVVTRYFGGIKLGKGGLVRAYTDCTKATLAEAEIIKQYHKTPLVFSFPYDYTGSVLHYITKMQASIQSSLYDQQVEFIIEIPRSLRDIFKNNIIDVTAGKVNFK